MNDHTKADAGSALEGRTNVGAGTGVGLKRLVRRWEVRGVCLVPCDLSITVTAGTAGEAVSKALEMRWQDYIANGYDDRAAFDWQPMAEEVDPPNEKAKP